MKSSHYDLKKIYFGLLEKDPDYPAWQDFEMETLIDHWHRLDEPCDFPEHRNFRYNPLPKKWQPKNGWYAKSFDISGELTKEDQDKIQAYATKLSWLREQGGYEFKGEHVNHEHLLGDIIPMNKEQAEKWLDMLKNGEV